MKRRVRLMRQILLFGIVGIISLLIDLAVTTFLFNFFNLPAFLAGAAGFLSGFLFNFPVNRKHVFNHSQNDRFRIKTQAILYFGLCLFNLCMTAVIMQVIVDAELLNISLAKICVTGLIAVWNFVIFKFWIFSRRPVTELETLVVQ